MARYADRMRWLCLLMLLAAPAYADIDPRDQARAFLDGQLVGLTDPDAFLAQLAPDTVLVGNGALALAGSSNAHAIAAELGSGWPTFATQIDRLDARAASDALWLSAEIVAVRSLRPRTASLIRITELVVHGKVAVVDFTTDPRGTATGDALGASKDGPLVKLLASPSRLDDALRDDAAATFDGTFAAGADEVRHAFADWHARTIKVTGAIEVHGKAGWSYALGSLAIDDARAMVLVVAIDGKVAALHVTSL